MSDSNKPVHRGDAIGALTARLIGLSETGEEQTPDLTAAPPLFDALMEEGDTQSAMLLRQEVGRMAMLLHAPDEADFRQKQRMIRGVASGLLACLQHLLFDLTSLSGSLAQMIAEASTPREVKAGTASIPTVRIKVGEHIRPGMQVTIDENQNGVVIGPRDAEGFVDVMPLDESEYQGEMGASSESMMGYPSPATVNRQFLGRRPGVRRFPG